jgi:hypothetical protein
MKQINGMYSCSSGSSVTGPTLIEYRQQFLTMSEAEIDDIIYPAQASLGYFLVWF